MSHTSASPDKRKRSTDKRPIQMERNLEARYKIEFYPTIESNRPVSRSDVPYNVERSQRVSQISYICLAREAFLGQKWRSFGTAIFGRRRG